MPADHERFMRLTIEEADKGGAEGNSAVGSIIVENDKVIGVGRNLALASHDPTATTRPFKAISTALCTVAGTSVRSPSIVHSVNGMARRLARANNTRLSVRT